MQRAMLYQRSYEANWMLVTLWVRNAPVDGEHIEVTASEYMKDQSQSNQRLVGLIAQLV